MAINVAVIRRRIDNDYSSTKTVYNVSNGITIHREFARLLGDTDIVNRVVEITFGQEFSGKPFGWVKVYRMRARGDDWVEANVLIRHATEDWLTTDGFELIIDEDESLTGVILEYYYTE